MCPDRGGGEGVGKGRGLVNGVKRILASSRVEGRDYINILAVADWSTRICSVGKGLYLPVH